MKKFFTSLMGGTVVVIGVTMLVLPGPGLLVIAGGLAMLATEFLWARRALRNAKGTAAKVRRKSGLKEWLRRRRAATTAKPILGMHESFVAENQTLKQNSLDSRRSVPETKPSCPSNPPSKPTSPPDSLAPAGGC